MRVAVLVLALLAGCKREAEANAPGSFRPAPRYSASLEATDETCIGAFAAYTGQVSLTARRRRVELAVSLVPNEGAYIGPPRKSGTCPWVGSGAVKQGRWVVAPARVDAADVGICDRREAPLEIECAPTVVRVDGADAAVLACAVTSPAQLERWLFRDDFMLPEGQLHARVQAFAGGTKWTLSRSR